jgi:hypothetical protein
MKQIGSPVSDSLRLNGPSKKREGIWAGNRSLMQLGMVLLLFAPISSILAALPAAAEEKLIAPPYPGSVRITPPNAKGRDVIVFFSQDHHDKVRAFYEPKYGRLPSDPVERHDTKIGVTLVVHTYEQALKIIQKSKGDFTQAEPSLIVLEWLPDGGAERTVPFFRELERQAKNFAGHEAELAELKKKYAWLARASYIDNMDDKIFRRCSNEARGMDPAMSDPGAMKAFQDKLWKLSEEGRYAEAAALMKQVEIKAAERRKADHFGLWKRCLEEAAGFAWLTRIKIQQDPSLWSY